MSELFKSIAATSSQLRRTVKECAAGVRLRHSSDLTLLFSSRCSQLRSLNLSGICFSLHCMTVLVQANLPNLKTLNLTNSQLGPSLLQLFTRASWPQLSALYLGGVLDRQATERSVVASCCCLAAGIWPQLQYLDISSNYFPVVAAAELVKGQWPKLNTVIAYRCNSITAPELLPVLAAASWPALQCVRLAYFDRYSPPQALKIPCWPQIATLEMSDCALSLQDIQTLVAADMPSLAVLDLSYCGLYEHCMDSLSQGNWPLLAELTLGGNSGILTTLPEQWGSLRVFDCAAWDEPQYGYTPDELCDLLSGCHAQKLERLAVYCIVDTENIEARPSINMWPASTSLAFTIYHPTSYTIKSLAAGYWPATLVAIVANDAMEFSSLLLDQLTKWDLPHMHTLSLSDLGLCDEKHMQVLQFLLQGSWPCLQKLDLGGNNLSHKSVLKLAGCNWPLLEVIDLSVRPWNLEQHFDTVCANRNPVLLKSQAVLMKSLQCTWPSLQVIFWEDD